MRRRAILKVGAASALLLSIASGLIAIQRPGLHTGQLSTGTGAMIRQVGRVMLDGILPVGHSADSALDGLVERVNTAVDALPPHVQRELSQLFALLGTSAGRRLMAGLRDDWAEASASDIQATLQDMRVSRFRLRRQAYQALHELINAAYFSDPATWDTIGYPGPAIA